MTDYKVSPFEHPRTPILSPIGIKLSCPTCGNEEKFLTVTSLGGNSLRGFVCAQCEDRTQRS